ncbi:MAG: tetratricopeptide repeat protein [Turneriella sp.]|nr:tetratricopeptide repeat protein [Turneriella sp.]
MILRISLTALILGWLTTGIYALDEADEQEAALRLSRAFNAYYSEKPVAAARAFEEYLKIKGDNEVALRYLARIALSSGDMTSAVLYLERGIKADPNGIYSLQLLSEIYLKQNKLDDALRVLGLILKGDPFNERALQVMAYIYQQKNDHRQAATYYKRLIIAVQKGTGNPDVMSQALYFLGNYYYQQDNFFKSLHYFRKLYELDSDNGRYLLIIGELQKITGQFKASASTHEKLIERQPDFAQAYESLAETYFILNDPRALAMIRKFKKFKKDEKPGILEGIEQQLLGKDDEALKAFERILGANQNRLSARLGRFRIYEKRKMVTDARNEAFAIVVIAQRLNAYELAREYAHVTLGYLNRQAQEIKFRENFFIPAKTLNPASVLEGTTEQLAIDFVELYTTHATTLENTGERTVAVTYQELAAQTIEQLQVWYNAMLKNPAITGDAQKLAKTEKRGREAKNQLYQTRVNLAWTQVNIKGALGDATRNADTALALEKEYATAYFVKGIIHNNLGEKNAEEYKTASSFFLRAIEITELKSKKKVAPANYYFYSGMALEKIDRFPDAEKQLKRTIELDPYNPTYLNYLGYMYSLRNMNLPDANMLVLRALEDDPENEAYLDTFGWIQFKLGNYREALEQLTVAASFAQKKSSVDPVIYFHLAEVHNKMNNRVTAIEYYNKTLADIKKASEPMDAAYIGAQIKKLESENKQSKKTAGQEASGAAEEKK